MYTARRFFSRLLSAMLAALMLLTGAAGAEVFDARGNLLREADLLQLEALLADSLTGVHMRLTLDSALQKAANDAIAAAFADEPHARVAVVAMDMQGRVLALADNVPEGPPMALTARAMPGQTLLPLTGLTALASGHLTLDERISDQGAFDLYDMIDAPRCWIENRLLKSHANLTFGDALRNGCEYYFYTAASRAGPDRWGILAQALGLDQPSGLSMPGEITSLLATPRTLYDPDLPVEAQPTVYPARVRGSVIQHLRLQAQGGGLSPTEEALDACTDALMRMAVETAQSDWVRGIREILIRDLAFPESLYMTQACIGPVYIWLNDIKWGGGNTIEAAAGRSFTQITPIAMARYMTAIANGGTVYSPLLVQSVGDPLSGQHAPTVALDLTDIVGPYLPATRDGLHGVIDISNGGASRAFINWQHIEQIACIAAAPPPESGGNGTWMAGFAPHENPQVAVVVLAVGDYGTERAAMVFRDVVEQYLR